MRANAKLYGLLGTILVILVLNLGFLAANLFVQLRRPAAAAAPHPTSTVEATAASASANTAQVPTVPAVAERGIQWQNAPLIAQVGGDETEDIVGLFTTVGDDGKLSYFVGAFDGATLSRLWRAGPIAIIERGEKAPILQIASGHLLAAESNAIHLYALASGEERGTIHTNDRVTELCLHGPDKTKVWARVEGGKNLLLDVALAEGKPLEAPPVGCGPPKPSKLEAPAAAGFAPSKVLVDGDVAIALGAKSPGTPVPMALGFDPKSKKVRWQHAIAEGEDPTSVVAGAGRIAELADGRLYTSYRKQAGAWQFAAIDGKAGDRAWEVPIPDGNASQGTVTVSPSRVYLFHGNWLDVFDKITGRQTGTLGEHTP